MDFKSLRIWKDAVSITLDVYRLIDNFPKTERYGLSSQIARSANSIGANIAESCGRYHFKDKVNFLYHARGSLIETEHHLFVAEKLSFVSNAEARKQFVKIKDLGIRLNNYIKTLKKSD